MFRPSFFPDRRFLPVSLLFLLTAGGGMAVPLVLMDLAVTDTAQLVLPSEPGKVYQLLASTDLNTWPEAGEPVFGTGEPIELWPPAQAKPATHQFFRVRIDTEPAGGLAPWKLTDTPLLLNEGDRAVKYEFGAEGAGFWKTGEITRPFTWVWLRTGKDSGKVTVNWPDGGAHEDLKLDFDGPLLGHFTRDQWAEGLLVNSSAGTFGAVPAAGSPLMPGALAGRKIALADGATGSVLSLDTTNAGTRSLDGDSRPVTYSWLVTGGNNINLTTSISPTHGEEYQLIFKGPQTGKFIRKTFTEGVFRDEDSGVFTLSEPNP